MNTLVVYDDLGYILSIRDGEPAPREPIGVPFLWIDIPEGKQLKITDGIGVDVSVTPHQVILEDRPPTIEEQLSDKDKQILELREKQVVTDRLLNENTLFQQDLLELLIETGVL